MSTKAERTRAHILEKVAPVFNMQGYFGTSLADITTAIGLSKGAVYGNFESKEALAIAAFDYNLRKVIFPMADTINAETTAAGKLRAIPAFYRKYYRQTMPIGGCPVLNVGIDSSHQNPALTARVQHVIKRLIDQMAEIIEAGKASGEFKAGCDPHIFSRRIYSMIEGSLFTATQLKNEQHLLEMMDHLDEMISRQLIA